MIRPAANPPSRRSSPSLLASSASAKTSTTNQRTASCELDSTVRSNSASVCPDERTATTATATATRTNATRISALCSALCVERTSVSSRIGPNSPTAPAASRYVPKRAAQLPGVGEDRQQGPDRRRRERGPDVDERDDHAGQGEQAAQGVGDRQRQRPAEQPQAQRHAADAGKVDLVAGEEEQHAEAEVAEELRERIDLGEIEQLRPDQHAERQLDHDHGDEQAAPAGHGDQHACHRRGGDDREERAGVDLEDRGRVDRQWYEARRAHVGCAWYARRGRRDDPTRPSGEPPSPGTGDRSVPTGCRGQPPVPRTFTARATTRITTT